MLVGKLSGTIGQLVDLLLEHVDFDVFGSIERLVQRLQTILDALERVLLDVELSGRKLGSCRLQMGVVTRDQLAYCVNFVPRRTLTETDDICAGLTVIPRLVNELPRFISERGHRFDFLRDSCGGLEVS